MVKAYRRDYPRPQMVRPLWKNLNGQWDFAFDDANCGVDRGWQEGISPQYKILVPFSFESTKSGIGRTEAHPVVWYQRSLGDCRKNGQRTVLHFEGSDYYTQVWVNGRFAGEHYGGYCRFSFDVTPLLQERENLLVVRVEDREETWQPRGKQRWKKENFGCWYTQTTGIWKTVWLEWHNQTYFKNIRIIPDLENREIAITWELQLPMERQDVTLTADISFEGRFVNRVAVERAQTVGSVRVGVRLDKDVGTDIMLWQPEQPNLYDVSFSLTSGGTVLDMVESYFGMRKIHAQDGRIWLNDRPLYERLILDQGYWPDSILTPPDEEAIVRDIDFTLELGFNGARKHQKIEDERYYFWCDVKGLLSWCEMPSGYEFGDRQSRAIAAEWEEAVCQLRNHPSIITWVPFNESWGINKVMVSPQQQQLANLLCLQAKVLDGTRFVVSNDGWEHAETDLITLHDYEQRAAVLRERYARKREEILAGMALFNGSHRALANGYIYAGQPVLISEYGGTALQGCEGWGYGTGVESPVRLIRQFEELTCAIKSIPWICGFCYTQLTDVEQEVNGLLSADRKYKVNPAQIREINLRDEEGCRYHENGRNER